MGVPQDTRAAGKWYRKTAEQADARAQHELAFIYVLEDNVIANMWASLAATQGNKDGNKVQYYVS